MKKLTGIISLLLLVVAAIAQDSTVYEGKAGIADVAEDDPGLFIFMMFMLMVIILALMFTVVLAGVFWALLMGLAFAGIVSMSVFMGWYQKSVSAGLIWFVLLCFGFVGVGRGMLIYLFFVGVSCLD